MLLIIIVSFKNPAFRPHSFSLTYLPILLYYGIQQVFCHSTYRTYILPESTNQARSANFFLMMSMILPFPFMNLFFGSRFPGFFLWAGVGGGSSDQISYLRHFSLLDGTYIPAPQSLLSIPPQRNSPSKIKEQAPSQKSPAPLLLLPSSCKLEQAT